MPTPAKEDLGIETDPNAHVQGQIIPKPKGIAERERPLGTGYCGNDDCLHLSHKSRRAAPKKLSKGAKHASK